MTDHPTHAPLHTHEIRDLVESKSTIAEATVVIDDLTRDLAVMTQVPVIYMDEAYLWSPPQTRAFLDYVDPDEGSPLCDQEIEDDPRGAE